MISRSAITHLMEAGLISVKPDPVKIGPNSIDLRFGNSLKQYHPTEGRVVVRDPQPGGRHYYAIDPKNPPPLIDVPKIHGEDAWLLVPGQFYLGATLEETYCRGVVPHLDGRSTCGRLSIEAHKTAGVGDNGFRGRWTLEIEVTEPVIIRPGDRLFQMYFSPCWGEGLAHLIHNRVDGNYPADICKLDPNFVDAGGLLPDGQPRHRVPLLDVDDLYGKGAGHHYQDSSEVRGPSPLD
jgi:deoxycytidine triphosphate deaminase